MITVIAIVIPLTFFAGYVLGTVREIKRNIALLDYMAEHINENERQAYNEARKAAEEVHT